MKPKAFDDLPGGMIPNGLFHPKDDDQHFLCKPPLESEVVRKPALVAVERVTQTKKCGIKIADLKI